MVSPFPKTCCAELAALLASFPAGDMGHNDKSDDGTGSNNYGGDDNCWDRRKAQENTGGEERRGWDIAVSERLEIVRSNDRCMYVCVGKSLPCPPLECKKPPPKIPSPLSPS